MMNEKQVKTMSKFLSLILRHQPETIGLTLDQNGWTDVAILLTKISENGKALTMEDLIFVVENNDKQRFVFSPDRLKIRANQGHSIEVDLKLEPTQPPSILFHGTATRNLESINRTGLTKQQRHHVHLSEDKAVALSVGQRYGKPVILTINAKEMTEAGHLFYRSNNGVWLTEMVPVEFISVP